MSPAAGTYRSARAGVVVSTAAELAAVGPDVVLRGEQRGYDLTHVVTFDLGDGKVEYGVLTTEGLPSGPEEVIEDHGPLTVLFRPDAPHPAVPDDAAERAALDESTTTPGMDPTTRVRAFNAWSAAHPERDEYGAFQAGYRAALAAAGAGGAVHEFTEDVDDYSMCTCGTPRDVHHLIERDVESVERETLAQAIATAIRRDRDPERVGHDPAPVDYIAADGVLALLAARGDAAPTVERIAHDLAKTTQLSGGNARAVVEAAQALAAPTVTAEQVRGAAAVIWPAPFANRHALTEQGNAVARLRAGLAALGIEVEGGEQA